MNKVIPLCQKGIAKQSVVIKTVKSGYTLRQCTNSGNHTGAHDTGLALLDVATSITKLQDPVNNMHDARKDRLAKIFQVQKLGGNSSRGRIMLPHFVPLHCPIMLLGAENIFFPLCQNLD